MTSLETLIDRCEALRLDPHVAGGALRGFTRILETVGASACSVVDYDPGSLAPSFVASTMNEGWLGDYLAQGFVFHDPFIGADSADKLVSDRSMPYDWARNQQIQRMYQCLRSHGYRCISTTYHRLSDKRLRAVFVASELEHDEFGAYRRHHKALSTYVASTVRAGQPGSEPWVQVGQSLSRRERQCLSLLGSGLQNNGIADALGLDDIMVRRHIVSARRKLSARAYEHALRLAMAREDA